MECGHKSGHSGNRFRSLAEIAPERQQPLIVHFDRYQARLIQFIRSFHYRAFWNGKEGWSLI
jgi:hypothetical protein